MQYDLHDVLFPGYWVPIWIQEGLEVASIARDVAIEMTTPRDHNAR